LVPSVDATNQDSEEDPTALGLGTIVSSASLFWVVASPCCSP